MPFPDSFINELTERSDIVDVVSSYVRLSKKSGSNLFGLCPFHSEKTPSFSVSPDKQIYHCFGCGKGGGVIGFVMEIENLSFPDAVAFLAKRAGMALPEENNDAESRKRARMLELNRDAARFFYEQLSTPAGQAARDYMARRGIGGAAAKNFGLGAAPDSWDSLEKAMRRKGYTDFELFDAGLVRRGRSGSFYDTFRNRLMFPVIDVRGSVIGFSGRILGDGEPKYMNSPETLVFNKSRNLFALNLAKKSKSGYILLVEGNIDVVSLHQAGFDSAVASLGTSLTPEQARLLSRYTGEVVLAYDSDGAGVKAAQRAIGILEKLDLKVRVLRMSGAKDPDEYLQTRGAPAFRNLLEGAEDQLDYRLQNIASRHDLNAPDQKVAFLKEAINMLARLPHQVEREVYARRVADMAGQSPEMVIREVESRRRQILRAAQRSAEKKQTRPTRESPAADRALQYRDPASAVAEEGVIRLLSMEPALAAREDLPAPEDFSSEALGQIYAVIREKLRRGDAVSPDLLGGTLEPAQISLLVRIQQKPELLANAETALSDYIKKIQDRKYKREHSEDMGDRFARIKKEKGEQGIT